MLDKQCEIDLWMLHSNLGRDILAKERIFYSQNIGKLFGLYSLQIGLPTINVFQGNKIVNHFHIGVDILCSGNYLPFAENSIDLIIMPHYLELYNNPQFIIGEISRILAPNGTLIISCFNAQSLLNLYKKSQPELKSLKFINLNQLKYCLIEHKLSIIGGKFFSYCPPFKQAARLKKYNFLNKVGDRWFPTLANSYTLICKKDTLNMTLIAPLSRTHSIKQPKLGVNSACHKN